MRVGLQEIMLYITDFSTDDMTISDDLFIITNLPGTTHRDMLTNTTTVLNTEQTNSVVVRVITMKEKDESRLLIKTAEGIATIPTTTEYRQLQTAITIIIQELRHPLQQPLTPEDLQRRKRLLIILLQEEVPKKM